MIEAGAGCGGRGLRSGLRNAQLAPAETRTAQRFANPDAELRRMRLSAERSGAGIDALDGAA